MSIPIQQLQDSKVTILTGRYGSGKSEVAINLALKRVDRLVDGAIEREKALRDEDDDDERGGGIFQDFLKSFIGTSTIDTPYLYDLDTINPYFRGGRAEAILRSAGVHYISGIHGGGNSDITSMPALKRDASKIYIDISGDEQGIKVLSSYKEQLDEIGGDVALFVVFNACREGSSLSEMEEYIGALRGVGLAPTGIISNSHLMDQTTRDVILQGQKEALAIQDALGTPLVGVTYPKGVVKKKELLDAVPREMLIPLKLYLKDKWME